MREHGARRIALAGCRFTRVPLRIASAALVAIAIAGGFVFYNTNILNDYVTPSAATKQSAEYERRYGRHAELAQPVVAATKLHSEVEAYKLKVGTNGREHRAPLDQAIDVAVFDEQGKPLYRQKHRIRSGQQTITVTVPRAPKSAGIDAEHKLLDRRRADNVKEIGGVYRLCIDLCHARRTRRINFAGNRRTGGERAGEAGRGAASRAADRHAGERAAGQRHGRDVGRRLAGG